MPNLTEMDMDSTRLEKDMLGELPVPRTALYGIHTVRAVANLGISGRRVDPLLIHAYGAVKLAAARTNHALGSWDDTTFAAIEDACCEMMSGTLDQHIVVDALQGGAGTSTHMNVNEVLANRALQLLGALPGDYGRISPLDDINLHQSTNDTYPTALKVAAIGGVRGLEKEIILLMESFQRKEKEFADVVKIGRTQMQDAVLTTMGRSMSAFAEALGRDRWRIYKCEERLRVVALGGTAIGTGLAAPRHYIFKVTEQLKVITGYGLARADNLVECTQNADVFAEVSGILNACAVNLYKIANDIRFMASGPDAGIGELILPALQAGSSIMPGKVNPVVLESAIQAAIATMADHTAITHACAAGNLELNPFLPLVADRLLSSIRVLSNACRIMAERCVSTMEVNREVCRRHVAGSTATLTALLDQIGYDTALSLLKEMKTCAKPLRELVIEKGLLSGEQYDERVSAEAATRLGSRESL